MPRYDLICKDCGHCIEDYSKLMSEPWPTCEKCGTTMKRNWSKKDIPGISWKGPGGSPLRGGGPTKPTFNTNEEEVEHELFSSIYEEE